MTGVNDGARDERGVGLENGSAIVRGGRKAVVVDKEWVVANCRNRVGTSQLASSRE